MSDVNFAEKQQLLAAYEGLRRGLISDSQEDHAEEAAKRERILHTPDEEFDRLCGKLVLDKTVTVTD